MSVEVARYTEFSEALHERSIRDRIPLLGTIEVSHRCSLNCSHCYNNLPMSDQAAIKRELSYEEHTRVLDELADLGCMWLLFTGGEIFARRDFVDIYTYAKRKGFIITLFTNGTMITPKVADYLVEWRPFSIEITLYGRTKETYERLTRIPGSYDKCMRGIALLRERGLPLSLKTVAVTINKHEIWEIKRFVEEDLGLSFKFDSMISPRTDCSASPLGVRLTPEEIVEIDVRDPELKSEWLGFTSRFTGPAHSPGKEDEVYHCGGGINSFAIDPDGKMTICVLSHQESFDLRQGSVREGWEHFLGRVREKKATRLTKCTTCQIKPLCGMCPANGELENGDPESPVDFLCHTAHLRSYALGAPVPAHGDCDYCEGGDAYAEVQQEVGRLRTGTRFKAPARRVVLPLYGAASEPPVVSGCSSGGCGSRGCGSH